MFRKARKKNAPDYRFIAIREPLEQTELFDTEEQQLPFPTLELKDSGAYKIFGLVTNRTDPGEEVIHWHRQRCGNSEKAHAVMKIWQVDAYLLGIWVRMRLGGYITNFGLQFECTND